MSRGAPGLLALPVERPHDLDGLTAPDLALEKALHGVGALAAELIATAAGTGQVGGTLVLWPGCIEQFLARRHHVVLAYELDQHRIDGLDHVPFTAVGDCALEAERVGV